MYLDELWKLGELQVVFAHLIPSQRAAAVILDLLVWIWLPLQGRCCLIRDFMNICHQEWFLKTKKKMDWALIRLICSKRLMVIQWLWPHFCVVESPRALSKTAFEYKWIMPSLLWPLAVTLIQLAVTIKRELGNLLTQQRYVPRKLLYSYFNMSMQWRASARWKTSKWSSAALLLPSGTLLGDSSSPEETTVHAEAQRRVTWTEKRVYCTGIRRCSSVTIFSTRLWHFMDRRNNRSLYKEFNTKLNKANEGEQSCVPLLK